MTRNLAIVFFEVVGYAEATARWTRDEAERAVLLHQDLLLPALAAFDGRLVKVSAGSYLAWFESPTNSALCAAALHDRVATLRQSTPGAPEFRTGIAMGEVRVQNKDVFGDAVNIAARLVALAAPSEILLAEVVYLAMNKVEVPSEEVGERELKGIPERIRVYRVPRGVYRLSSAGPATPGNEGLPYGGLGLAHAPNLPAVNVDHPGSASSLFPRIGALAPAAHRAFDTASAVIRAGQGLVFRRRSAAIGVALVAAIGVLLVVMLPRLLSVITGDPIERLIDRGDLQGAKAAIDLLPKGGRRSYLEGRVIEDAQPARAVPHYVDAARDGERAALRRLVTLLERNDCEAKERAARALGALRESSARSALKRLAETGEDQGVKIGSFFSIGCNSASAARAALAALDEVDGG